jgi:hypothetical protein
MLRKSKGKNPILSPHLLFRIYKFLVSTPLSHDKEVGDCEQVTGIKNSRWWLDVAQVVDCLLSKYRP